MTEEEIIKLNRILIGRISPFGDSGIDEQIKENLTVCIGVVDELMFSLQNSAGFKNRSEKSMQEVGKMAVDYLKNLNKNLSEFLEEAEND